MELHNCVVLLSCYNGENYIEQQIDSIFKQKNVNISILARDDGSSDKTKKILCRYRNLYPEKFEFFEGSNVGIHQSFFELINKCPLKEYVAFADQDDIWDEDKICIAIKKMLENNCDFYSSASRLVGSHLENLGTTTACYKKTTYYMNGINSVLSPGEQGCTIVVSNIFFDYIRTKGIPEYYGHDTWFTVVAYYTHHCIYDPIPHMSYRQHDNSWTGNRKKKFRQLLKEFSFFIKGMKRYSVISKDILDRFKDDIDDDEKALLYVLCKPHKQMRDKIKLIFNPKFGKYGFVPNMFFKFCILIGKV